MEKELDSKEDFDSYLKKLLVSKKLGISHRILKYVLTKYVPEENVKWSCGPLEDIQPFIEWDNAHTEEMDIQIIKEWNFENE